MVVLCDIHQTVVLTSLGVLLDRATCFIDDSVLGCVLDIVDGAYDLFMLWSYIRREN